jgi:hypothetical protein
MYNRYASFDYEEGPLRSADLILLDLLVNGKAVDALGRLVPAGAVAVQLLQGQLHSWLLLLHGYCCCRVGCAGVAAAACVSTQSAVPCRPVWFSSSRQQQHALKRWLVAMSGLHHICKVMAGDYVRFNIIFAHECSHLGTSTGP